MRLKSYSFISLLLILSYLGSFGPVLAQAGKAELTGVVHDPNSAVVSDARVVVTEIATGQSYFATVTDSGDYTITNLKPGAVLVVIHLLGKSFIAADC